MVGTSGGVVCTPDLLAILPDLPQFFPKNKEITAWQQGSPAIRRKTEVTRKGLDEI
jgi:hypothetical protein